ncbi:MAG: hypothetical protein KBS81_08410 [Spirochaetales bacterium]|nr:hypothetical protein [Candidatus Physcosoma equi]
MKRILVVLMLLLSLSFLFAGETGENKVFHYSSSIFLSNFGVAREEGRKEFDLTFSSTFPNMIPIGWIPGDGTDEEGDEIPYSFRQFGKDAWNSLVLMGLLHADYRYDLLPSTRQDLDVGGGVVLGVMNLDWEAAILGALLETNVRYTWNFQNGNGLFVSLELPLLGYFADVSPDGVFGEFFASPLNLGIPFLYGFYAGLSCGFRLAF